MAMDQKAMPLSPQSIRPPLVDASNRVDKYPTPRAVQGEGLMRDQHYLTSPQPMSIVTSPLSQKGYVDNNCVSPLIHSAVEFTRNSTVSADSIVSNQGKRKTHVGPWQLGKNLGEGATGRVRLAKHMSTGQTAAIKIVSKKSAAMAQSDSIAAMDRNIGFHSKTGVRQMPSGIEREVVIMKLIEHPNVVRLYDVWENRGELYLVLEYVEGGELFNYLSKYGPLEEFEAVKLFRQIIAGLAYCHRFSICHRDLKPENILLDSQHNVKLADFGMAALQPAGHWLKTSCGSPHYAAPEIIKGRNYRGDKADLWSCGIILFALLTGYLPFDGGDLSSTLRLVKTAKVEIPEHLSDEAADLIYQILQKRPEDRISMRDIWLHPLMRRYECLDPVLSNPFIGPAPPLSVHECGPPVHSRLDIEEELLRNLQTLWHDVKREALIEKLLNAEPTHERMFYNALIKFRNEQLENYQGQALEYSASDYHHMSRGPKRPSIPRNNGRSRGSRRRGQVPTPRNASLSSSVQEPKSSATVESYDPFRSPHHVVPEKESAYARITIHRDIPDIAKRCREAEGTVTSNAISEEDFEDDIECLPSSPFAVLRNKKKLSSVKSFQSRTSHTGTRRPLNGMATPRSASYKRNVCFRHVRNRSQGSAITKAEAAAERVVDGNMRENSLESIDVGPCAEQESSPLLPAQPGLVRGAGVALRTCAPQKTLRECDFIWREDARQVSHELSQICEEAFNGGSLSTVCTTTSTCMSPETPATSVAMMSPQVSHSRISTHNGKGPGTPSRCGGWPRSYTAAELAETRRKLLAHSTQDGSEDVPGYLVAVISHLDRLIEEDKLRQRDIDESVHVSVEESVTIAHEASGLSIISEAMDAGSDITHANSQSYRRVRPQSISTNSARISRDGLRTVRMVPQSSSHSIDIVRPLTIRKKSQQGAPQDNQHQHVDSQSTPEGEKIASSRFSSLNSRYSRTLCELDPIAEIPPKLEKCHATSYPENKKWSWLPIKSHIPTETTNRVPKPLHPSNGTVIVHEVKPSADPTTQSQHSEKNRVAAIGKHKGGFFRKLMKLKGSKSSHPTTSKQPHPNLANQREAESQATETIPILTGSTEALGLINADKPLPQRPRGSRKSVNWFSRMFQFKPATRVLALNVSKMKGRKEVYKILREWKPYGMKSVSLDKANSVIHGEVAENNLRRIRPVEFSAEFYTVLERGRQANLSLVQFKQEKGAVSSFNEVVDALHKEMKQRGLLEENPFRAKEMMEVLDKFDHL